MSTNAEHLRDAYLAARGAVVALGYGSEIRWQERLTLGRVTETDFLREAAWVILSSGMRETVIRGVFPAVSNAFHQWQSAARIMKHCDACKSEALLHFGHRPKINAILQIAATIDSAGFAAVKQQLAAEGVEYLRSFPYLGPATAFHLAKNLGMDVVKPDRHLLRVTEAAGFSSPEALCREISRHVTDRMAVIDLVIWRFATLSRTYVAHFAVADGAPTAGPGH